jgi:hypothetical protein
MLLLLLLLLLLADNPHGLVEGLEYFRRSA